MITTSIISRCNLRSALVLINNYDHEYARFIIRSGPTANITGTDETEAMCPRKQETLIRCWLKVGPVSQTLDQPQTSIGST